MDRTLLPNATQFPDVLTDQVMPLVSGNEWKVIHYGVRYALGHRSSDTLTIAQFANGRQTGDGTWLDHGTGLSEAEVKECLAFLCDIAHIFLREDQPRKPLGYRLNLDLSSINWAALEQRHSSPTLSATVHPVPPPLYVETPVTDVRLGSSDGPLVAVLHERLRPNERQTFDYLLALAGGKGISQDDMTIWQLYSLWRTYGYRRLHNAFQSPMATNLDELSKSCLVGSVVEMLEAEKFGQITEMMRNKIVVLADEWPRLEDWQEAIRSAVLYNSRRLATVEKNLKRQAAQLVSETIGDKPHAGSATSAPGHKRTTRRVSQYTEEELRAAREADRGKEWLPPPE